MEKKELLKKIYKAKEIYDKIILNKNFLYIYKNTINNRIEYIESTNLSSNFLHLTGVKTKLKAKDFYKQLDNKKIKLENIDLDSNGWTRVKLDIFPRLPILFNSPIQISLQDNMYTLAFQADLIINKPNLQREDIILGLKKDVKSSYYAPSSIIKRKPQMLGNYFSRVLFILSKEISKEKYDVLNYKVENISLNDTLKKIEIELKEKISLEMK
ncbi:MAG: PBECR4 domain-containing protein [Fusobacteriaceae bacterium]